MPSKYPRFHRYVNRAYIGLVLLLVVALPLCHLFTDEPSISGIIIIFIAILVSYAIYWLTVRTNCYGERTDQPPAPEMVIAPTAQRNDSSAQSAHSRGSSNSHASTNQPYPTFANYRLGDMRDRLRRWTSGGARSEEEETETTANEEVANPPPTYSVALEGAGLPPPYTSGSDTNESVSIIVDDGSNNNTSSRRTASVSSTSSAPRSPTSWLFGLTPFKSTTSSSQRSSPTNLLTPPPAFTSGSTPVAQATPTQSSTQTSQSNSQSDHIPPPRRAPPAPPQSPNNQSPS